MRKEEPEGHADAASRVTTLGQVIGPDAARDTNNA